MSPEQRCAGANQTRKVLQGTSNLHSKGAIRISLGFYLGMAVLCVLVAGAVLLGPAKRPMINPHADPTPAEQLESQVVVSPGSNIYHAGDACPYAHNNAASMTKQEAMQQGLAPCPYCIGNSAAHLTPTVLPKTRRN